jgi:hypothetical protein
MSCATIVDVEKGTPEPARKTSATEAMEREHCRFIKGIVISVVLMSGMFTAFTMYIRLRELQMVSQNPNSFTLAYRV